LASDHPVRANVLVSFALVELDKHIAARETARVMQMISDSFQSVVASLGHQFVAYWAIANCCFAG